MAGKLIVAEMRELLNQFDREEITFSRMVEIINQKFERKEMPKASDVLSIILTEAPGTAAETILKLFKYTDENNG